MTLILLVFALFCELVAALVSFGVLNSWNVTGWIALGLSFWVAALIVGSALALRRPE